VVLIIFLWSTSNIISSTVPLFSELLKFEVESLTSFSNIVKHLVRLLLAESMHAESPKTIMLPLVELKGNGRKGTIPNIGEIRSFLSI
jgi:hypothetical protein